MKQRELYERRHPVKLLLQTIAAIILLILVIILLNSCTKGDYIKKPTCFRYLELSDKWDAELNYQKTDTIWPNNRLSQIVCDDDTSIFYTSFPLTGCITGWQQFRYIKLSY